MEFFEGLLRFEDVPEGKLKERYRFAQEDMDGLEEVALSVMPPRSRSTGGGQIYVQTKSGLGFWVQVEGVKFHPTIFTCVYRERVVSVPSAYVLDWQGSNGEWERVAELAAESY